MHTGPNLNIDNLVFGYDTGFPMISGSKDTTYKFNLGVPIKNAARSMTSWPTQARATVSVYSGPIEPPIPGEAIYKVTCNADTAGILIRDGGLYYGGGFAGTGNAANTDLLSHRANSYTPVGQNKFIYSLYIRPTDNTLSNTTATIDIGDRNNVTKTGVADLTDWYKISTNDSLGLHSNYPYDFFDLSFSPNTVGNEILVSAVQILRTPGSESGSLKTPSSNIQHLTYGAERAFTNSLKDLKNTYSIDTTNASFDNNTNIEFDGTDDFVRIPYTATDLDGDPLFSVEAVVKRTGTLGNSGFWGIGGDGTGKGINSYVFSSHPNKVTIDLWGTATFRTDIDYPLNEYIHVVWVKKEPGFSTSTIIIYINGVAYTGDDFTVIRGSSHTPDLNTSTSGKGLVLGRVGPATTLYHGSVELPFIKFYNDVLSAEQIQDHFNAVRNRFEI